jgi:hypothetical protein
MGSLIIEILRIWRRNGNFIKVILFVILKMDLVNWFYQIMNIIKVNLKMIKYMEMVYLLLNVDKLLKDFGIILNLVEIFDFIFTYLLI